MSTDTEALIASVLGNQADDDHSSELVLVDEIHNLFWHAEHPVFVQELHQTVAPGLRWPQPSFPKDPLHRWLIGGHRRTAFDLVTA
jgi:hypothetical protein